MQNPPFERINIAQKGAFVNAFRRFFKLKLAFLAKNQPHFFIDN
jgi:hypothetical protein